MFIYLKGEPEEEEDVELAQTDEDLVLEEHGFEATVGAKEFVDIPAELLCAAERPNQ
jgi:hypothetical protein